MIKTDLCVLGAGSGGLSVAAGAAQMGARVVLVEASAMGGDCLNTGCVPSKALLAAAHAAHSVRSAAQFGVTVDAMSVDATKVWAHVNATIKSIEPHDSQERFESLGVHVIRARGHFIDERTLNAGGETIRAKRFVVATGARAAMPAIPGLKDVPYLTNETLFDLDLLPEHLLVIGGGPIGVEMAQAFARLGSKVSVFDLASILPRDDTDFVDVVRQSLLADGVSLHEGCSITGIESGPAVVLSEGTRIEGSHLLIATGRAPNVDELGLKAASIDYDQTGIKVDARLRTSNKRVFAIGDVIGGLQFTHVAGYHAGVVIKNALFRIPAKADHRCVPKVTYCDPELAQVGSLEVLGTDRVLAEDFANNDRARAEGRTQGMIKVVTDKKGGIKGVSIVGPHAGDLLQPWLLAMNQGLKIGALATIIAPYPSLGEINKRAAGSFYTPTLYGPRTRALVKLLGWLP